MRGFTSKLIDRALLKEFASKEIALKIAIVAGAFFAATPAFAQSGQAAFTQHCAECHSSDFRADLDRPYRASPGAPPRLAHFVDRSDEERWLVRFYNGILYDMPLFVRDPVPAAELAANPTRNGRLIKHLPESDARAIYQMIKAALEETPPSFSASANASQAERIKVARCNKIKYRIENNPPPVPEYIPPGHEACDGDSLRRPDDTPWRPSGWHCKPWLTDEDRSWYQANCAAQTAQTQQMSVPTIQQTAPPASLPETIRDAARPGGAIGEQIGRRIGDETPAALVPDRTNAEVAELECRAGGSLYAKLVKPVAGDWEARWPARWGIERGLSTGNLYDEHWKFEIRAQLHEPNTVTTSPGWCRWVGDFRYGLGNGAGPNRRIAIDLRILPQQLPFDQMAMAGGDDFVFTPMDHREAGRNTAARAAVDFFSAIRSGGGMVRLQVIHSDHGPLDDGTVVFEHPDNDYLGFRPEPQPREDGPE